ncbi:MAG: cation transporter, partial [Candidatus Nanopelagicales bacterium]
MKEVLLHLEGMTCTSCANQIEKELNKLSGTKASVNYATATAAIISEGSVQVDYLIETVEKLGYRASLEEIDEDEALRTLGRKRNVAVVIGGSA